MSVAVGVGVAGGTAVSVGVAVAAAVPGRGEVRIRVHACGVCHSDQFVTDGLWAGLQLPRVPGHEVAGVIDAVGEGVTRSGPATASASAGTAVTTAPAARV